MRNNSIQNQIKVAHYSGGSALASAKIKAMASNQSIGNTEYAQFGY